MHDQLLGVFSRETLQARVAEHAEGGRWRVYPPLVTLGLFVEQVIGCDAPCQDAVARALSWRTALGLPASSLNTGPYCKARQRLPLSLIEQLARDVAARAEAQAPAAWRGRRVWLIDGTTVSMPDTAALQRAFPQNHQQRAGLGFPLARLVGVVSLSSACVSAWTVSACEGHGTHESRHLWQLLEQFQPGDVVIADRAYGSYFVLAALQQRGIDFVIREHQGRKTGAAHRRRLGERDHALTWDKPQRPSWMSAATYAGFAESLTVREVRNRRLAVVTSLAEPAQVAAAEVLRLYRSRWHIELDFRSIKAGMGMDILRCKSPDMIHKEIAAHLLGYNLVRHAMGQAASPGARVRQLSFAAARRAVSRFQDRRRYSPDAPFLLHHKQLHQCIAFYPIPSRPGRVEPRAIKRRPKPRALLMQPRRIAREQLIKQINTA